jgi:hypothetical protein
MVNKKGNQQKQVAATAQNNPEHHILQSIILRNLNPTN